MADPATEEVFPDGHWVQSSVAVVAFQMHLSLRPWHVAEEVFDAHPVDVEASAGLHDVGQEPA
jgi:hypothetical protein